MNASNLEEALYLLMGKSDASHADPSEFRARMESLREYGRLPRGRENHATLLNDEQIADAVLGLTAVKPGWAGHFALILRTLKPVGGKTASFDGVENLSESVQRLLTDKQARERLIDLSLTSAEHGTNANGHATLRYQSKGEEKTVHFVHQLALSLHGVGAEKEYDPKSWAGPSSRQLVLSRGFFENLAKRIEVIRHLKPGPASDGSEYDATEAEDRRRKALGVRDNSRYLNVGVDNQVTWPRTETLATFDRYTMVLLPKTKDKLVGAARSWQAAESRPLLMPKAQSNWALMSSRLGALWWLIPSGLQKSAARPKRPSFRGSPVMKRRLQTP